MIILILKCFIVLYVISMSLCLYYKRALLAFVEGTESKIYTHEAVINLLTYFPLANTLLLISVVYNHFHTKYLIYKTKKILSRIVGKISDPDLKKEITDLLNKEL